METITIVVIFLIIVALCFDFTNGFNDAANAIATVVATKAMSMNQALAMSAFFNLIGAFAATGVAKTIEKGLITEIDDSLTTQIVVISALFGAIAWNIVMWYFGMPSSSYHAMVGGLVGTGIAYAHPHEVIWSGVWHIVIIPMVTSPIVGMIIAAMILSVLYFFSDRIRPDKREPLFKKLQIFAGALMSFSHGSNDAQKVMGVITLALVGAKMQPENSDISGWVVLLCAVAMAAGTYSGGRKIIDTTGHKITKLTQESGFAANIGGSITIFIASMLGIPVSTTQVVVGSITGSGLVRTQHDGQLMPVTLDSSVNVVASYDLVPENNVVASVSSATPSETSSGINWRTMRHITTAWVLTLPGSAFVGGTMFLILSALLLRG